MRSLLSSMGFGCRGSTTVFEDNKSTIKLSEGSGCHSRTKHIGVRWHALRDWIRNGDLSLEYIPKGEQQAELLGGGHLEMAFQLRSIAADDGFSGLQAGDDFGEAAVAGAGFDACRCKAAVLLADKNCPATIEVDDG